MLAPQRKSEQKVVASAVILRGKRALIVLRPKNNEPFSAKWELPGGTVKLDEGPAATVVREVKEETGLEIGEIQVISAEHYKTRPRKGLIRHTIQITYLARAKSLRGLRLSREHTRYSWVRRQELGNYLLVPVMKHVLQRALAKK